MNRIYRMAKPQPRNTREELRVRVFQHSAADVREAGVEPA
jgi:hypothetical protein